jgi:methyl-CpG-binding domain protein 4
MWKFFDLWPTASDASRANFDEVHELVKDLGLGERRAKTLIKMSEDYLSWDKKDPKTLRGIGEYASSAYKIFCEHNWAGIPEPKDGALKNYWRWINNKETKVA